MQDRQTSHPDVQALSSWTGEVDKSRVSRCTRSTLPSDERGLLSQSYNVVTTGSRRAGKSLYLEE